jgi:hypothetical protein
MSPNALGVRQRPATDYFAYSLLVVMPKSIRLASAPTSANWVGESFNSRQI